MREPIVLLILAWLVPGFGHLALGKRWRGIAFFLVITSTFAIGMRLTEGRAVDPKESRLTFFAQAPAGIPALAGAYMAKQRDARMAAGEIPRETEIPERLVSTIDLGVLYTMIAGLLNLLIAVDAFERGVLAKARAREEGALAGEPQPPPATDVVATPSPGEAAPSSAPPGAMSPPDVAPMHEPVTGADAPARSPGGPS